MFLGRNRRWVPLKDIFGSFLGIMWSNNLKSEKYANSRCSHMQHILFFLFSPSFPPPPPIFFRGRLENFRSFNVLELNIRRKSEILNQFEMDQSQPFCLSGMYMQVNLVIVHSHLRKAWIQIMLTISMDKEHFWPATPFKTSITLIIIKSSGIPSGSTVVPSVRWEDLSVDEKFPRFVSEELW